MFEKGGRYHELVVPAFDARDSRFSHADLRPENILVDPESLRITGIVDWEWAGWYPRCWDRVVASIAHNIYLGKKSSSWKTIYEQVFPSYIEEAEAFAMLITAADND